MIQQITLVTHSLYVKLSKNNKDYGEPDITYQLAGSAEQRPLGIPMGDACSARTTTARHSRFLRPFNSKRHPSGCRANDAVGGSDMTPIQP